MNIPFDLNGKMITPEQFLNSELEWGISIDNPLFINLCNETLKQIQDLKKYSKLLVFIHPFWPNSLLN